MVVLCEHRFVRDSLQCRKGGPRKFCGEKAQVYPSFLPPAWTGPLSLSGVGIFPSTQRLWHTTTISIKRESQAYVLAIDKGTLQHGLAMTEKSSCLVLVIFSTIFSAIFLHFSSGLEVPVEQNALRFHVTKLYPCRAPSWIQVILNRVQLTCLLFFY